jgi:hypothetical protein
MINGKAFLTFFAFGSLLACADLAAFPNQYAQNRQPYGNGYYNNNQQYYGDPYENERQRIEAERQGVERERLRIERDRLEQEKRNLNQRYNQQQYTTPPNYQQGYQQPPAYQPPQQASCPPGFSPSENKCSNKERKNGCKDIRLPSGLGCVRR